MRVTRYEMRVAGYGFRDARYLKSRITYPESRIPNRIPRIPNRGSCIAQRRRHRTDTIMTPTRTQTLIAAACVHFWCTLVQNGVS